MTDLAEPRSARASLSPTARALRLQRIFARLQEGASYAAIATEEGLSRERLRQIVKAAATRRQSPPDHKKMQFARLEPALRLAARGVAEGDAKAIPLLIKLIDRLDRYCDPGLFEDSPLLADLVPRRRRRRPGRSAPLPSDEEAVEPGAEPPGA
jgi:transposase-like protein